MNPFFKNSNIFQPEKALFSSKKLLRNWAYFTKILKISSFQFIWSVSINPEKISNEIYYPVEKFLSKRHRSGRTIGNDWNSWKFYSKSTGIPRKIQDTQLLMNNFQRKQKTKKPRAKVCAFGPKWKKFSKIPRKIWDILTKISMEKWSFFINFYRYFCVFSERIYRWKITTVSTTFFPISGVG